MIADLASIPMTELGIPITNGIIPILALLVMHLLISFINLKSLRMRELICGKPSMLIYRGKINEEVLKKERFTINELQERLRGNNIVNIADVEYAILENNGELTIIKKDNCIMLSPDPLIMDGKINKTALARITKDEVWLVEELKKLGFIDISKLFLVLYLKNGLYVVPFKKGDNINKVK